MSDLKIEDLFEESNVTGEVAQSDEPFMPMERRKKQEDVVDVGEKLKDEVKQRARKVLQRLEGGNEE